MLTVDDETVGAAAVTYNTIASKVGGLTVVARDGTVVGLCVPGHWHRPDPASFGSGSNVGFDALRDQIGEYLNGERGDFEVTVATNGDGYQERVWSLVRQIPYSQTVTHGDLARQLRDGTAAQEVGAAVGRSAVCLIIPCHRVVGAGGKLTGYAGGLARKCFFLDLEAEVEGRASRLF
jgi:methylated-DNA-[protein]-cysteine S-methyltransferase